jgi:hypothetical protein
MLCEKGLREVYQVGDYFIAGIGPKRCKLEAVAGLFTLAALAVAKLLYMGVSGGVGIILRMRAV